MNPSTPGTLLNVLIRVNASPRIGAGHAARSSALGHALRVIGANVTYACDQSTVPYLIERGVEETSIRCLFNSATEGKSGEEPVPAAAQIADAKATLENVPTNPDWVVVDSYLLTSPWQSEIRKCGFRVAVFDDLCDRLIDADLVINAAGTSAMYASWAANTIILTGLEYAVTCSPRESNKPAESGTSVLIAFGAADPTDMTSCALRALADGGLANRIPTFHAWIQLGRNAPNRLAVESLAASLSWADMLEPTGPIDAVKRGIVLAIGAAGVGLLERMRDGMPTVIFPVANNQRPLASIAVKSGAAILIDGTKDPSNLVEKLLLAPVRLAALAAKGKAAVDGDADQRIARLMNQIVGVTLRRAQQDDAMLLHQWRNHPAIRASSFNQNEISLDEHFKWFQASLMNPDRHILIARRHEKPVGMLRYDTSGDHATAAILVDPIFHNRGLGVAMLNAGTKWAATHLPAVQTLHASIRPENTSSVRTFERAGYHRNGEAYERSVRP